MPAGIQLVFLVFVIFKPPYRKTVVSIRAIINESVIELIFAVTFLYTRDTMNALATAENAWGEFISVPAWVETALIVAALLMNSGCQIYAIYNAACSKKSAEVAP